jgi:molybdopterin molybdotransferase
MVDIEHALKTILENTDVLHTRSIKLQESFGFTLAEDIMSDINIPPFDKSAMDGYAVRSRDIADGITEFTVSGMVAAGSVPEDRVAPGHCMKIMTGAPVPEGADAVVMVEQTETFSDGRVRITVPASPGQNICRKGEDVSSGRRVLRRGLVIDAAEIAVLASVGKTGVRVINKPKVGILTTGSEIVEPEMTPPAGAIRNSNGPMLSSLVRKTGSSVEYLGIGKDDTHELRALFEKGLQKHVFLVSGGVSMGDYDLVPEILKDVGARLLFHRVRIKPGKPLLFARRGACHIFGIPGNPVSNLTTFHMFIKPALLKLMGRVDYLPRFLHAQLEEEVHRKGSRTHILPSRYRITEGAIWVQPLKLNGSADIVGCSGSNALVLIDRSRRTVHREETVEAMLLS